MKLDLYTLYVGHVTTFVLMTTILLLIGLRYHQEQALRIWGVAGVLACAAFGSISGSTVATTATIAQVAYPQMRRIGLDALQNQPPRSMGRQPQTGQGLSISHIYRTDSELPLQAAPLAKPGVEAKIGDIITAINGKPVTDIAGLTNLLRNQAGKQVLLSLQRGKQQWQTVVEPVSAGQDSMLRYHDWVSANQQTVAKASEQQFGYLHLYAMGPNDIANFAREFYAHYDKPGLIIDVRRNRGGNIDSWIIEKLLRRAWSFWQPTQGSAYTNMQQAFRGHLVVLADPLTYSDGETFSAGVRALGLGPVIGQRTAGAGVWLSGRNLLADRGVARVAETPQFAMDGRYIIEGYGVEPDLQVVNLPYASFNGQDAQLEAAIEYLTQQLKQQPVQPLRAASVRARPLLAPHRGLSGRQY